MFVITLNLTVGWMLLAATSLPVAQDLPECIPIFVNEPHVAYVPDTTLTIRDPAGNSLPHSTIRRVVLHHTHD